MKKMTFAEMFRDSGMPGDFYVERTDHGNLELQLSAVITNSPVIVWGKSKNGKTALVEHVLSRKGLVEDRNYINISCYKDLTLTDLYDEIYRAIDITPKVLVHRRTERRGGFGLTLPSWLGGAKVDGGGGQSNAETFEDQISYDPNAVATALIDKGISHVKIENIHYGTDQLRKDFAQHLRVFLDNDVKIIIIGVGKNETDLYKYNSDLKGRLRTIEVPPMSREVTETLILHMAKIINLEIFDAGVNAIRQKCERSPLKIVSFFRIVCEELNITKPLRNSLTLPNERVRKMLQRYKNIL
ncbi:MAG: hypothetical protein AAF639_05215 [Chloroflexota bacterium]